jgi:hypothetical protein
MGRSLKDMTLAEMDVFWEDAKKGEVSTCLKFDHFLCFSNSAFGFQLVEIDAGF